MANLGNRLNIFNIVAIILIIVGLVWLIQTLWKNWKINQIRSWPKASATVINVFAEPANAAAGSVYVDPSTIVATTGNNARYIPRVLYRYTVNGKEYQSNNVIYSGPHSYSALDIKILLGQIYPNAVIPVFYDPHNPGTSYIYNGNPRYLGAIIGALLVIIGGYILFQKNYKATVKSGINTLNKYTKKLNTTVTEALDRTKNSIIITPTTRGGLY